MYDRQEEIGGLSTREQAAEDAIHTLQSIAAFWHEAMSNLSALATKHGIKISERGFTCIAEAIEEDLATAINQAEETLGGGETLDDLLPQTRRDRIMREAAKTTGGRLCSTLPSATEILFQGLRPFPVNPATPAVAAKLED